MALDKPLLLAILSGFCIGGTVYRFLLPDWFFAFGITAVYVGVSYFYFAYGRTVLGEHIAFENTRDKFGHAVGLFGLSISPLALVEYAGFQTLEVIGVLVWTTGTIAYLLFASSAQNQRRQ